MSKEANSKRRLSWIYSCTGVLALSLPLSLPGQAETIRRPGSSAMQMQGPSQSSQSAASKASEMQNQKTKQQTQTTNAKQNEMQKLKSTSGAQGGVGSARDAMKDAASTTKGGAASEMQKAAKPTTSSNAAQEMKANLGQSKGGTASALSGLQKQQQTQQKQNLGGMGAERQAR